MSRKSWYEIYTAKSESDYSWFEEVPEESLLLIKKLRLSRSARIIDVGCGDSRLAAALLSEGFTEISVLDISSVAVTKSRQRMGQRADQIQWIVGYKKFSI